MDVEQVIDRIAELLDEPGSESSVTSVRIRSNLRAAQDLAREHLGLTEPIGQLVEQGIAQALRGVVFRAGLQAYFARYPESRPSLGQVAFALAEQEADPLCRLGPQVFEQAAAQIVADHADASPEDVIVWVHAQEALRKQTRAA
ncbi:MAG: hypothetical protein FWF02_09605 [Micrococcales bacterium]|nr:hypothetical protein [Micrococcales bacterium]MCL2667944.1 hypothetical protein [Micrococcales bacterium]